MKNSLIILAIAVSLMSSLTYAKEHTNGHQVVSKKAIPKHDKKIGIIHNKRNTIVKKANKKPIKHFAVNKNPIKKYNVVGIASWYGYESGPRTASGAYFNPKKLTAAHRYIAFGTKVKVTNLKNNKSVVVVINDRGPFIKGRIIDLSKAAAIEIGIKGTEKVSLNIVN